MARSYGPASAPATDDAEYNDDGWSSDDDRDRLIYEAKRLLGMLEPNDRQHVLDGLHEAIAGQERAAEVHPRDVIPF